MRLRGSSRRRSAAVVLHSEAEVRQTLRQKVSPHGKRRLLCRSAVLDVNTDSFVVEVGTKRCVGSRATPLLRL